MRLSALFLVLLVSGTTWAQEATVPVKMAVPKNPEQLIAEGQEYFKKGRYDLAEKRARQTLAIDPVNSEARMLLKNIGSQLARYDQRYFPQLGRPVSAPPANPNSSDQRYVVRFPEKDQFVVQDSTGKKVFSSGDAPSLRDIAEYKADSVYWRGDSQAVALSGGGGHDLQTYVLAKTTEGFVLLPIHKMAEGYDNAHILPYQWLGERLLLEISGPYAGKSDGYFYKGIASVRVRTAPPRCELLYEEIK